MHTTVFEYGYLSFDKSARDELGAELISKSAFEYLKEVCLSANESETSKCLGLTKRYGHELIQVKNYVGYYLPRLVSILKCCRKQVVRLLIEKQ